MPQFDISYRFKSGSEEHERKPADSIQGAVEIVESELASGSHWLHFDRGEDQVFSVLKSEVVAFYAGVAYAMVPDKMGGFIRGEPMP